MSLGLEIRKTARAADELGAIPSHHRRLAACVARLDHELAWRVAGAGSADGEVRAMLVELRRLLLSHLSAEEQSGVLERAARVEPRFARRIGELLNEHEDLRRRATTLAEGPGPRGVAADWAAFRTHFVAFREVIEGHEQAENEILQSVYLEDLGGRG